MPWSACSETSSRCTGQVEGGRQIQATDDPAKLIIYRVLVETVLDAPKYLVRDAHDAYVRAIAVFFNSRIAEPGILMEGFIHPISFRNSGTKTQYRA